MKRFQNRGFTLMEVLVALAVMVLVLAFLFQISGLTFQTTRNSHKQMEGAEQARAIFDALSTDLSSLVSEFGLAVFVKPDGPSARLAFLSSGRGPSGVTDFRFLSVAYSLEGTQLLRRLSTVPWNDPKLVDGAIAADSASLNTALADGVLRFEVVLMLDDGTTVPISESGTWISDKVEGQTIPNGFKALVTSGSAPNPTKPCVRGLIVAIATLSKADLKLPGAADIAGKLPAPASGESPLSVWNAVLLQNGLDGSPQPALASLQIAQRTFLLK